MIDERLKAEAEAVERQARRARQALSILEPDDEAPIDPEAMLRRYARGRLSEEEIAHVVAEARERRDEPIVTPPEKLPPPADWRRSRLVETAVPGEFIAPIVGDAVREEAPILDLRRWMDGPDPDEGGRLCVLAGKVGTGKTFGMVWCAVERIRRIRAALRTQGRPSWELAAAGGTAFFCTAQQIAEYAGGQAIANAERALGVDVLLLDELGDEVVSREEDHKRLLRVLTERRRDPAKWTLATTNLNRYQARDSSGRLLNRDEPLQFCERYGERLDDRVGDNWFSFNGPSLRGRRAR